MSEIQPPVTGKQNKRHVRLCKKLSTKVDLTPMVDLGFLLITFFVFTTSISAPKAMKLVLPEDRNVKDSTEIPVRKTLNLILGGDDIVYYYNGGDAANMQTSNYSPSGIRQVILNKKATVKKLFSTDTGTVILIKPTEKANYKNVVDAMDEMAINNIKIYFLLDADEKEKAIIRSIK